jgi:transposase-like protein
MAAMRVYAPEEKLKIVHDGMSSTVSVSDLRRNYDLKTVMRPTIELEHYKDTYIEKRNR